MKKLSVKMTEKDLDILAKILEGDLKARPGLALNSYLQEISNLLKEIIRKRKENSLDVNLDSDDIVHISKEISTYFENGKHSPGFIEFLILSAVKLMKEVDFFE